MNFDMLRRQGLALGLGVIAGYAAYRIGMPLPWMLGPMLINTLAAMLKMPIAAPTKLRPYVIPVIGVMLGASVSAEIIARLPEWFTTLVIMIPFLASAAIVSLFVYMKVGKYDFITAYFSAMPGGLVDMLTLGTAYGGKENKIALAHASRILVVISFVGMYYGLVLGVTAGGSGGRPWIAVGSLDISDWLILGGCAVLGVPFGKLLRLPAAGMLGPMLLSAAAHVPHWVEIAPPTILVVAAQIVLGTIIGSRFIGVALGEMVKDVGLGVVACTGMLAVGVIYASITAAITGVPVSAVFLAYSPGGLTEMSLLALSMGQEVAYVSVMHILRILLIIMSAPAVFKRIGVKPA